MAAMWHPHGSALLCDTGCSGQIKPSSTRMCSCTCGNSLCPKLAQKLRVSSGGGEQGQETGMASLMLAGDALPGGAARLGWRSAMVTGSSSVALNFR